MKIVRRLAGQRLSGGGRPESQERMCASIDAALLSAGRARALGGSDGRPPCLPPAPSNSQRNPPNQRFLPCSVPPSFLPQVTDEALAALGCPAHLTCLRLDFCVDVTDAGLALLQGGSQMMAAVGVRCQARVCLGYGLSGRLALLQLGVPCIKPEACWAQPVLGV